jgi:hypothetical protein
MLSFMSRVEEPLSFRDALGVLFELETTCLYVDTCFILSIMRYFELKED